MGRFFVMVVHRWQLNEIQNKIKHTRLRIDHELGIDAEILRQGYVCWETSGCS